MSSIEIVLFVEAAIAMLQERLNSLAMCSIEKDILEDINLDTILEDFAPRNARRRFFIRHRSIIFLFEVVIIMVIIFSFLLHYCYVLLTIYIYI